ncbi:hypothetical protein OE810_00740 [Rhodobacteraceae bacterium XHP0102]|nr:hypothetical protein [Rhodobacteraceae bacterium XHP0102]
MMRALPLIALALLVACGPPKPPTMAQAEAQCRQRADAATGPQTQISVGVGTGGTSAGVQIGLSSDYLAGRDPEDVYTTCVTRLTGQAPETPLYPETGSQ